MILGRAGRSCTSQIQVCDSCAESIAFTVPNFVPCVPEFVPYRDVNSCDSVVMGRIIG
jgi:hypothetical protein